MQALIDRSAVAALDDQRVDWRHKGLPVAWTGRAAAEIRAERPDLFAAGPLGPICVLRADALEHNLTTMAGWCAHHGVELAPHGKTHMAPQLVARQFEAGACARCCWPTNWSAPPGCGRSAPTSSGCGPRPCGYAHCVRAAMIVTAGGSTHFDLVAEILTGGWRTIVRSGAYLTNDDGLYLRTSPLTRPGAQPDGFRAAMHVWAQVCSRPEPGLALLTMGRRDV
jgi:D-serine deaminase-like pyridoxal phosphate-dependent protein